MISPFTPPGTKIICINDDIRFSTNKTSKGNMGGLKSEAVYTVLKIVESRTAPEGFNVILEEINRENETGFRLARFRRLDLPSSITSLLNTQDIPKELLLEDA